MFRKTSTQKCGVIPDKPVSMRLTGVCNHTTRMFKDANYI